MTQPASDIHAADFSAMKEITRMLENHRQIVSDGGKPVAGYFCSYTPVEILTAAGLQPYRIVPGPGRAITRADTYIDRNFCPYVRTCLGEALDGQYEFLSGLVMVNSCDAMRRLYDVWRYNIGGGFVHLLDLPRIDSESSIDYFLECLVRLKGEIESHYRVDISDEKLAAAIDERNRSRSLLKELYLLNLERGQPLSGTQVNSVVRASTVLPREGFITVLERLLEEIGGTGKKTGVEGPRLMVTGSVLENPHILGLIEQCGARVVVDDLCTGTRQFWLTVEAGNRPLDALARHYLRRVTCPRMKDAGRRFDHVFQLIDEFSVKGVIFYTMKFCDPFLYDVPVLRERLAGRGIPSLALEGDYTPGTLGRVKTRIEAFIEMLRQRVQAA
jgi:benzoyl-CoA reductase/2-hydroxyglutaryl-CoA dehydratase subunit BcrC/BadD/HgdB